VTCVAANKQRRCAGALKALFSFLFEPMGVEGRGEEGGCKIRTGKKNQIYLWKSESANGTCHDGLLQMLKHLKRISK